MFLSDLSIKKPVLVTVGLLVLLIFGYISFSRLNINQMPSVDIPYVFISTVYPGAGPKDIESQITEKIEDAVGTLSQLKRIESYSLDGVSIVLLEFKLSKDVDVANQEVKDKVDQIINELPDDAMQPITQKADLQAFPIIDVVLSGDQDPRALYDYANNILKDRLAQVKGVGAVNIVGGQEREIQVELNNSNMFENFISLPQLLGILKAQNMDIPGGSFDISDQEYSARFKGQFNTVEEINELQVPTPFGNKKLRQVADIKDGAKTIRQRAVYYDNAAKNRNENVVRLSVIKSIDGNVVDVSEQIHKLVPELQETLPKGMSINVVNDRSTFVKNTVDDTLGNVYLGILFTSIVLFLFLADIRSTLVIALSMPISIISTFSLVSMAGYTLNSMSLMGISVSVGVLVANSVVVLENIFRHKDMGLDKKRSAAVGTSEVAVAVLASTLTNIVVFVPIGMMDSMVGRFLAELAFTATFATIFSLLISFTLTPMLAALLLPEKPKVGKFGALANKANDFFEGLYKRSLAWTLNKGWRSLALVAFTGIFFILTIVFTASHLSGDFMPTVDNGKLKVDIELPVGYNLDQTTKVAKIIESRLKKYDDVEFILSNVGKLDEVEIGANLARMEVSLIKANDRKLSQKDYINLFVKDLADIPNADIRVGELEGMGPGGAPIEFYLQGQDAETLERYKDKIMSSFKTIPGLTNFTNSSKKGKPELTLLPKRDKLAEAGLMTSDLAMTLRASMEGIVSTQFREKGNEYDVTVTMGDESINTPEEVGNIPVIGRTGVYRMSELADVTYTSGYTRLMRKDKFSTIKFTGAPAEGFALADITSEIDKRIPELGLPVGYRISYGGVAEMFQEMIADFLFAFLIAVILTYLLIAAMLESFFQPILIMLTVPLGLIGVLWAMLVGGVTFNITSMMGIIMLIGIVVNNAILMLDYTNQLRREQKMSLKQALIEGSPTKLKPIIMSTVAIILGLLPMAMGIGDAGKEIRVPLGVVSVGGLISSTALTLYFIPAFYIVMHILAERIGKIFRPFISRFKTEESQVPEAPQEPEEGFESAEPKLV